MEAAASVQTSAPSQSHSSAAEHERKLKQSWDDMVEKSLGNFGWMEFLQAVLVAVAMFFDAQQSFISIYTDNYPTWHCTNTNTNNTTTTCSSASDICKIPRSSWSWDSHPSMTIISHWGLECASTFITGLPQSAFFIGCLLGSSVLAALADSSLGRKNMLVFSCVSMSITSLLIIFSPNIWVYSALKFLIGFWRSSIGTCVLVLLTENVSAEWRFRVGIVEYFTFAMGYMSLPGIAYVNRSRSWRSLYLCTSAPALFYPVLAYLFVTESPRWLLMQGRVKEAMKILKGVTLSEHNANFIETLKPKKKVSIFQLYSSIGELFKKRWALTRMVAVMVLGIGVGMVYFGMPLAVGNLGFNIYLAVVFNGLMEFPSFIVVYFLENCRRKPSILVFYFLGGICCLMCVFVGDESQVAKVGLAMASFFFACTAYSVFLIYIIELFPTCVRNTTTSLVRQAVTFGCIFIPFLISVGRKNNLFSYGVFGIVIILSNLTLFGLPETMGIVLCDTMDEQEKKETLRDETGNL
ncbi:organic cation/carnitine transporter 3-like [Lotus japonicus]|uniref:organic cation/carnitine transporter 3-like n=1 Tax=Lotus japonicus TaxID=34305 RepID=UPI00258DFD76|nr:organic cation/carnitine transporter 3-like [Lotus japonicus]